MKRIFCILLSFWVLGALAASDSLWAFYGVAAGPAAPAAPVYFGAQVRERVVAGPLFWNLDGRLELGEAVAASGVAWLGLHPLPQFELRAGYGSWIAAAPAGGRAWGARAAWRISDSFSLLGAYSWRRSWGGGLLFSKGGLQLSAMGLVEGWLLDASWRNSGYELRGWCRAAWRPLVPDRFGLEGKWRSGPYHLVLGYDTFWGFSASAGWRPQDFSFALSGRLSPGKSAVIVADIGYRLSDDVKMEARVRRVFMPYQSYNLSLEVLVRGR